MNHLGDYDVIVIGAGHAGIEAAHAAATLGAKTAVFTMSLDAIGNMPCNPSIGGTAKGTLVRELDALGGVMGLAADATYLQSRMLNKGKGPAVHALRVQTDRKRYHEYMKHALELTPGLAIHQAEVVSIEVEDDVTAYLEFANGATGTFIASTGDALGENRLEIIGTRARIRIENDQLTLDTLSVDERDWCPVCKEPFGVPDIQHEIVQTDGENPQHAGVLNAFAAHILHGTPLVADGREGIRGLMLSNAMHLSSWTNQTVSLPIDEELFLKLLNEKRRTSRHKDEVDAAIDVSGSFGSTRK